MKKPLLCITIILLIIILFGIGIIIPKYLISDGLGNFKGEEKEFAKYALLQTALFGNYFQKKPRIKIKVIDIKKINDEKCFIYIEDNPDGFYINSQYVAKVRTYKLFYIPLELLIGLGDFEIYCMEYYIRK